MDDGKKKTVMLVIIGICLLIVAIMVAARMGSRQGEVPAFEGRKTWMLCRNEACKAEYEIPLNEYHVYVQENDDPRSSSAPPMTCQKCGEKSLFKAVGCAKCGLVYEMGSIFSVTGDRNDYPDRCPKCKYSQRETDRGIVYKPK